MCLLLRRVAKADLNVAFLSHCWKVVVFKPGHLRNGSFSNQWKDLGTMFWITRDEEGWTFFTIPTCMFDVCSVDSLRTWRLYWYAQGRYLQVNGSVEEALPSLPEFSLRLSLRCWSFWVWRKPQDSAAWWRGSVPSPYICFHMNHLNRLTVWLSRCDLHSNTLNKENQLISSCWVSLCDSQDCTVCAQQCCNYWLTEQGRPASAFSHWICGRQLLCRIQFYWVLGTLSLWSHSQEKWDLD